MAPPFSARARPTKNTKIKIATSSSITMNFVSLKSNGSLPANGCGIAMWPCEPAGAMNCGTWKFGASPRRG